MSPIKALLLATFGTIASANSTFDTVFTVTISQPNGPLNGKTVNAAGGLFYTGLSGPSVFCPEDPSCPAVTGTVFPDIGLSALNYLYVRCSALFLLTIL